MQTDDEKKLGDLLEDVEKRTNAEITAFADKLAAETRDSISALQSDLRLHLDAFRAAVVESAKSVTELQALLNTATEDTRHRVSELQHGLSARLGDLEMGVKMLSEEQRQWVPGKFGWILIAGISALLGLMVWTLVLLRAEQ